MSQQSERSLMSMEYNSEEELESVSFDWLQWGLASRV